MGAKTWMLVYSAGDPRPALAARPALDGEATRRLAEALFPEERLSLAGEADLSRADPPDRELRIGCFPGVAIVAAEEFAIDHPSKLAPRFLGAGAGERVTLLAMHGVVDWFAYARWADGELQRSLSVSPDDGVMEDLGQRLPFEAPYWAGEHPVERGEDDDPYPLPFHPLELGEAAMAALLGCPLEGAVEDAALLDPESVPLLRYRRSRPSRWAFWRRAKRPGLP